MKPKILKSNLLNTGTRFVATNDVKDTVLPPGSVGFFSLFKNPDRDYQNVVHNTAVIIRRGKGGQDRLEAKEISFPIFTDKRMLEHEEYLPTGRKLYIHVEEKPFTEKSLMEVKPLEFLGWCYAYNRYLNYLTRNYAYPAKNNGWINEVVGRILTNVDVLPEHFSGDPKSALRTFSTPKFRAEYIMAVRKLEARLVRCMCSYKKTVMAAVLNSSYFVEHTNKKHYEVVDKKLTKDTIAFYKTKYDELSKMVDNNRISTKKKGL